MVVSTDPADNDSNVVLNKIVSATFNMAMDSSSLTPSSFTLSANNIAVAGTVSYVNGTAFLLRKVVTGFYNL